MVQPAPFFSEVARAPEGQTSVFLTCKDGTRVRVATWRGGDKGTILIFQGRTEYIEKYGPAVQNFLSLGYSVAAIDWRGQGLSDRSGKQRNIGHVENFTDYNQDVDALVEYVTDEGFPTPLSIACHSMGGAIGLHALLNKVPIDKAIFSAPMWGIYFKGIMRPVSRILVGGAHVFGAGSVLAPSTKLQNYATVAPFEDNTLTNDREQFEWSAHQMMQHPELELGGPSMHWIREAFESTNRLLRDAPSHRDCLCFYGTEERIVSTDIIDEIMARWRNGKLVKIDGAQHELFIEEQHVLDLIWSEIKSFLES